MKSKRIGTFLKLNFLCFSLLIVLVFMAVNVFIHRMGDKYLLTQAKYYFADTLIQEDSFKINTKYIHSIGGWFSVLDENLHVIYTTGKEETDCYTQRQLISLTKGEEVRNHENIYASMKYFTDESGTERLGIVCIPAKHVQTTTTIMNIHYGVQNILWIYVCGFLLLIGGYMLAVSALSYYMNKQLTNPVYRIMEAFQKVSMGDYEVRVDFHSVTEFEEIKDSFHRMVKRLFDMEEEKKIAYRQRQQMLMDLGHDLKTPVTIIQGYSSALADGRAPIERKEKWIRIMKEHAVHMAELIELLLDYTRFDCTAYRMTLKNSDLGEFLRRIVIEKLLLFEEKGFQMIIDIPEKRIEAFIDEKILKRAVINLLNNLLQHNPSGVRVWIGLTERKEMIVADSGAMIPDDIKDQIFEPFVCGDEARQPDKHNHGLGLSITKKIVEMHHGRLYLEQTWKEYTKAFMIQLP